MDSPKRKSPASLSGPDKLVAAQLLATKKRRADVARHFNIHRITLWKLVPAEMVEAAKAKRAWLREEGLPLPVLPVIDQPPNKPRPEQPAKMDPKDYHVAAHLRASGVRISDVAAHFNVSTCRLKHHVTREMTHAAKAEQDALKAKGLPLPEMPDLPRKGPGLRGLIKIKSSVT